MESAHRVEFVQECGLPFISSFLPCLATVSLQLMLCDIMFTLTFF